MFDEHGSDYKPIAPPRPEAPAAKPLRPVAALPTQQPWGLRLGNYILMFIFVARVCAVAGDDVLTALIHFASAGVLGITILGIMRMQRWAIWMFLAYCAWMMGAAVVVGIARIRLIDTVITRAIDQQNILLSEIFTIFMVFMVYGGLAAWYGYHWRHFKAPAPPAALRYGYAPLALMLGVLFLYSATQINNAPEHLRLQQEISEDSRQRVDNLIKNWFGD